VELLSTDPDFPVFLRGLPKAFWDVLRYLDQHGGSEVTSRERSSEVNFILLRFVTRYGGYHNMGKIY